MKAQRIGVSCLAITALIVAVLAQPASLASADNNFILSVAKGQAPAALLDTGHGVRRLPALSAGVVATALDEERAQEADAGPGSDIVQASINTVGCGQRNAAGIDIRVNQDCTYRRQAEESITYNPANPTNLVAGQNDSRIGFNHCGFDYSFDSGQHWGDGIPPFWQHLNSPTAGHTTTGGVGTLHTYDAASDPAVTFDSRGNAYYSCVLFDISDNASAILVARSPAGAGGSFYNNVPTSGSAYVAVEDNTSQGAGTAPGNAISSHDKEFIVADSYPTSPYRDNVYVTWTLFESAPYCNVKGSGGNPQFSYCASPVFFSRSTDHGVTWSPPQEISGSSSSLCSFGNAFNPKASANSCDFDQGSDPTVLPDGTLVVVFNNGNTAAGNPNGQQLAVVSHDGGVTWSAPVKVGDDVVSGEPLCDFGRGPEQCIPGPYIRTNDFPRIGVDRSTGTLYATWQDYRTGEYDIQLSRSTDEGATWQPAAAPVNPDTGKDHYMPAVAVSAVTHTVAVSYYRSGRVSNENTPPAGGFAPGQPGVQAESSDYSLAYGSALTTPYTATVVSPSFPPPDGIQVGFNGDYSGLTVVGTTAHPIWSDTRNTVPLSGQGVVHDEDVFTTSVSIP